MRTVDGFALRKVCGENILVPEGMNLVSFNKMISLNPTAAFLWENIMGGKEFTAEDLEKLLLENYEVTEDVVKTDVANVIAAWKDAGIVAD